MNDPYRTPGKPAETDQEKLQRLQAEYDYWASRNVAFISAEARAEIDAGYRKAKDALVKHWARMRYGVGSSRAAEPKVESK